MQLAVQTFIGQIAVGSLYALVAVGFVIIYKSTKVINFAQGMFSLIGGYFFYTMSVSLGLGLFAGLVATVLASIAFGAILYGVILKPLIGQSHLTLVMLTIALDIVLRALAQILWGNETYFIKSPIEGTVHFPGGVSLPALDVAVTAFSVTALGAFAWALRYSRFGSAMRAAAEDPRLAAYRGINVALVAGATWAIAVVGASLAGISYGAIIGLSPGLGLVLSFAAFPAVIIGGLDSVGGALIGAMVLAQVQGFAILYVGGGFAEVAGYVLLLLVLVVRPRGLFGSREMVRL